MELFSYFGLHTVYLFVFSISLGLGIGVSVLSHILFLSAADDGKISRDEFKLLSLTRKASWVAILMYGFSGLGLFTLAYESMIGLGIFYASMTVAMILIGNEIVFSFRHLPRVHDTRDGSAALDAFVLESGAVSLVSWIFLMFHHVIYRTDIGYFAFMALYTAVVVFAVLVTWFVRRDSVRPHDAIILKRSLFAALLLAIIFTGAWYTKADRVIKPEEIGTKILTEIVGVTYTADDVALHNNSEDCWLIIDKKVFNATEASRLHPAMFNCGQDVSENYHKNHGKDIREKMMKYYIGELRAGKGITNVDVPFEKNKILSPYRELYVKESSWNPRDLMLVVEKDAEKLLAIDGTTHEIIGRIHNVGFQPHTSVFSSDAKYMYIISRDGWLTKIDLETLEPIVSVSVGENSRGTALTDNDKYVAIGNYAPGNLVILDTESMKILKTIPLITKMDGKDVESRAGAVIENGNQIVVALKGTNSVWSVDTDKPDFPVTNKFEGIGKNIPALHDAFLTPNGKYYIVASQGSKTAWVLDLKTMKPITEVQTGETPHTGPGAAWGDYIYVPALGEGLITVIDTKTWKPAKYIKTGGPGLFVRSYSKDPSYPYVWADTAFGDHKDEIYVIDARVNEIVKTIIPVKGESSWHPEFTYDGRFVYVVSQSANEVEVYDAHTFDIVKRIKSDTPSAISNVGLRIEEPGL
jgi:DNA-binding beta-propeller fold protein YncE